MGLFDNIKAKSADLKEARGGKLASIQAEYMGGYGEKKKAKGTLTFYEKQTEFKNPLLNKRLWFTIDNVKISDIAIEGKDEVNRRVTVTRLLTLGIFAFGRQKKVHDRDAYITLVLADGQEVIFHTEDKAPMELKVSLAAAVSQVKKNLL